MYTYQNNNNNEIDISGEYKTNYKDMRLYQHGNKVVGRYELYNGVLEGILKDNVLTGMWFQTDSLGECNYGPYRFEFTRNYFLGQFGYCDYMSEKTWTGIRK